MAVKTFSSKQYKWADISVVMGGRILEGITAVEYTKKREKDFLYGRGDDPHEIVGGNNSYEGKLTLWQSEVEAMIRDAPGKDITKLELEIVIAYVPEDGGQIVTDILKKVQFSEMKKGMVQGDKNMVIDLPFMFTKLKLQQ